ncbi:MAG TPA: malto-oligosyltrehalose trehalohydrolase [Ornithinimicrobium sp.]|uniref:malto-oligosyltrehalose trehalohydrolase n=1 Tax=Ornithinimicrobium sp. TaxID=1977084 RepID=UPI002B48CEE4|nr:malto-oligosyltrehalose trehalohydrolase [Ornithinimicrobium sp.]HKJ13216.1 malto-oligosyltrehalose trehalohydrolase [Ornithinimicrobium sp.]
MSLPDRFTVWSPGAERVDVHVGTADVEVVAMERDEDGWWSAPVPARVGGDEPADSALGARYAFAVDGGDPFPDPRSVLQPDGVHQPSQLVDLQAHDWSDDDWSGVELKGSCLYEMHVGTFTDEGTFDAATTRLDHLVDLGVSTIELLPVAAFPGEYGWGYDGVSPYAVHGPYGGPLGLQRFVDAAHARGLAVYLDVVYNHLGPSGNYLSQFGPYFTDKHHTPWGEAVNLDAASSDQVRAYLLDNVRMWLLDFHLDGLRLDAVHELHDERAVHILEEMAALADAITEQTAVPRVLVAESDRNDPATVAPRAGGGVGGLGLHGQWADDVHHSLHAALTGETQGYYADFVEPGVLVKVLGQTPFLHDGTLSTFRGRVHGRPVDPEVTPGWRFVASLQTHDQVGNRAGGDRLCHLTSDGMSAIGAALLLTSPYTPMLFMGEEWAASTPWQYFTQHEEEWLAQSIRDGRNAEFASHGWSESVPDPQAQQTVEDSRLDWAERSQERHARMLDWYRLLLQLRRSVPDLRDTPLGQTQVDFDSDREVWWVRRGDVTVVANFAEDETRVALPDGLTGTHPLAAWDGARVDGGEVVLDGHDVLVLGPEQGEA